MRKVEKLACLLELEIENQGSTSMVAKKVTYIFCILDFLENLKKFKGGEPHILETCQYPYPWEN